MSDDNKERKQYLDPEWNIHCSWQGCNKLADIHRCPWADFAYCTEHDDLMGKMLDEYNEGIAEDENQNKNG